MYGVIGAARSCVVQRFPVCHGELCRSLNFSAGAPVCLSSTWGVSGGGCPPALSPHLLYGQHSDTSPPICLLLDGGTYPGWAFKPCPDVGSRRRWGVAGAEATGAGLN